MTKLSVLACVLAMACPAVALADPGADPQPPAPRPGALDPDSTPATIAPAPDPTPAPTAVIVTPPPVVVAPAPQPVTPAYDTNTVIVAQPYVPLWDEDRLASGIGVAASIGGGVSGFTDRQMRQTMSSDVSGLWDARLTFGTHIPIGLDLGYLGTAANLNTLTGTQTATLVGTTVEAALRWNILPHQPVNPYIFAGMGWQRYDVTGRTVSLSDSGMNPSDNSIEFPMGAGLSFRDRSGLTVDARGTFRANTDQGLVLEPGSTTSYVPMHTWEASAAVGYEF